MSALTRTDLFFLMVVVSIVVPVVAVAIRRRPPVRVDQRCTGSEPPSEPPGRRKLTALPGRWPRPADRHIPPQGGLER